ncbi:polyketide synthase [Colletotrichum truncatum]|uniref:Polyketide synthase n=1 Tax=Colletotrichum truncatum TaxID=5467 RepID=A0ACC3Z2E4_COLTU|nr:polyketide synthase [Colletotrichum truncatum]KAF6780838.1 polyketide synthase [Colletotrichum truncatum]
MGEPDNVSPCFGDDPVAICGMAMRLPGGVSNAEQFWDMLMQKRCASVPVPKDRFNIDGYYSQKPRPGTIQTKTAYFLDHVQLDRFDATHFSFGRSELEQMDPLQRLLLEISWECLENAGETDWQGKTVGCYVGSFIEDWSVEMQRDSQYYSNYPTGKWDIMLSNRISHAFDFRGPSMTVKTGCSSSLVALNLAVQSLILGECTSALVAGCSLFLSAPSSAAGASGTLGNIASPDGICKTFDAASDGIGRGEAINAVYLKRLSQALRDGNPVRAVIRSIATQHDGREPGLIIPNGYAQEALIRHTYDKAGIIKYSETSFFECHGTGTRIGDLAEVGAIERIFGKEGMIIGAVKPNVGHSEGAAALTSIIKVVLMLERGIIAPNTNFNTPNPNLPWADGRIRVASEPEPFPLDRLRRVSVNSFGMGGANSHAILEYPSMGVDGQLNPYIQPRMNTSSVVTEECHILLLSASNPKSLELLHQAYRQYAVTISEPYNLSDLAYTLGCRRTMLKYRGFFVARHGKNGERTTTQPELKLSASSSDEQKTLVFVFNGQGAQWPTMGKTLILTNNIFRQCIQDLDRVLRGLKASWTIEGELLKSETESRVMQSEYALPCSTAIQIGLLAVLRNWTVDPDIVVGHSSGEITAAFAAGALTANEAIIVAYFRGYILNRTGKRHSGAMAAIGAGSEDTSGWLLPGVVVACENSDVNTTISGDACAVETVVERFKTDGIFAKILPVDHAFHSEHMKEYGLAYEMAIRPFLNTAAPRVPFFSSVTGGYVKVDESLGAAHWHQSLVQPVLFNKALRSLLKQTKTPNVVIVEIGARPSLKSPIKQILESIPHSKASYLPTLEENKDCHESLLRLAGRLFCEGINFDHKAIAPPGKTLTNTPTYTWAHEQSFQGQHRLFRAYRDSQYPMHELLGSPVFETSALEPSWRKVLLLEDIPWLGDHVVNDQVIIPFAAYISIAEQALRQVNGGCLESFFAQDFSVSAALRLDPGRPVEIHTRLRRLIFNENAPPSYDVQITSWKDNVWTEHCHTIVTAGTHRVQKRFAKREFPRLLSRNAWYKITQELGFTYGPSFRRLEDISVSPSVQQATARVNPPEETSADSTCSYLLHPTALDQCLQTTGIALCHGLERNAKYMAAPTYIKELLVRRYVGPFWATGMMDQVAQGHLSGTVHAYNDDGREIVVMQGIEGHQISSALQLETEAPPIVSTAHWHAHASFFPFQTLYGTPFFDADEIKKMQHLLFLQLLEMRSKYAQDNNFEDALPTCATRSWVEKQIQRAQETGYGVLSATTCRDIIQDNRDDHQVAHQKLRIKLQSSHLHDMEPTMDQLFKDPIRQTKETLRESIVSRGLWPLRAKKLLADAMHVLTHTNPQLRILQIGSGGIGHSMALTLRELLQPDKGTRLFSMFTYAAVSQDPLDIPKDAFTDTHGLEVRNWDAVGGDRDLNVVAHSCDVIVCTNILSAERNTLQDLQHIKHLLHPSGLLILLELLSGDSLLSSLDFLLQNDSPPISEDVLLPILRDLGFDVDQSDQHRSQLPPIMRLCTLNQVESSSSTITIVTNHQQSALIKNFKSVLHSYSVSARTYDAATCINQSASLPAEGALIFFLDLERPWIYHLTETEFAEFVRLLSTGTQKRPIVWVTPLSQISCKNPQTALIYGLARTLRSELKADITIVEVDLEDDADSDELAKLLTRIVQHLPHRCFADPFDPDFEFAITMEHGIMDVIIAKEAFKASQVLLGQEAAGIITGVGDDVTNFQVGDRVVVLLTGKGAVASHLDVLPSRCLRLDKNFAFEAAAAMPLACVKAELTVKKFGRIEGGEVVIVLFTLSDVCLATVQLLREIRADSRFIITSEPDGLLLENAFGIVRDSIASVPEDASPWPKAAYMIGFGGHVSDWVLSCLSPTGTLLDVLDYSDNFEAYERPRIFASQAYRSVNLQTLSFYDPDTVQRAWKTCQVHFVGISQPADWARLAKIFKPNQVQEAFRAAVGQEVQADSKVVLQIPTPDPLGNFPSSFAEVIPASPRFRSDAAYLLVGGLGGIGCAVATWMAEHGAGELVFFSRSAGTRLETESFLDELRSQDCVVKTVTGSVARLEDITRAVNAADRPIAGVFQMSMVLRDAATLRMTYDEWRACIEPKIRGTENIHTALSQHSLDFFVLFSSIGGLVGNLGQANYNSANTYLDAFVRYRHHLGLPASVIDIGIMGGIGIIASTGNMQDRARSAGYHILREQDLLEAITISMHHSRPSPTPSQDNAYHHLSQMALGLWSEQGLADPSTHVLWKKNAHTSAAHSIHLESLPAESQVNSSTESGLTTIMMIAKSTPKRLLDEETLRLIGKLLGTAIAQLLNLSSAEIGPATGLDDLGLDSLNANELTSWVSQYLLVDLPLPDLIQSATMHDLATKIAVLLLVKFGDALI